MRLLVFLFFLLISTPLLAQESAYASLAYSKANLRVGAGGHFPILWQYQRAGLPLKITDVYKKWRKVEDAAGGSGWLHSRLLSSKRRLLILARTDSALHPLRRRANNHSGIIAFVEAGTIAALNQCERFWCKISFNKNKTSGWLETKYLWGLDKHEAEYFKLDN